MLLVYISAILTTPPLLWVTGPVRAEKTSGAGYTLAIAIILLGHLPVCKLWEAIASAAVRLRQIPYRQPNDVEAHKIPAASCREDVTAVSSASLKKGDLVLVKGRGTNPSCGRGGDRGRSFGR